MGMAYPSQSNTSDSCTNSRVATQRSLRALAVALAMSGMAEATTSEPLVKNDNPRPRDNTPKGPQAYRKFGTVKQLGRKQRGSFGLYLLSMVCLVLVVFGLLSVGRVLRVAYPPDTNTSMAQLEKDQVQLQKELDLLAERVNLLQQLLEAKGVLQPKK